MPKVQEQIVQRFGELEGQCRAIRLRDDGSGAYADPEQFYAWATSSLNATQAVFGKESPHFTGFEKEMASISDNFVRNRRLDSFRGIFLGAKRGQVRSREGMGSRGHGVRSCFPPDRC